MSVELIRDLLKIDQVTGENHTQALVEGDILVPDIKPDISNVLSVDGMVNITKKEILQDKIVVDGVVNFKIFYTAETGDQPMYSMNASAGFNQNIDMPGIKSDMMSEVIAAVEHVDFQITNERKLAVKSVVNLSAKALDSSKMDVLREIYGLEDVQVLRNKIQYNDLVGSNQAETIVRETFEIDEDLPEIREILRCEAVAVEKETKVTDGKVIISGIVKTNTLYLGEDERNPMIQLKHEIPFTHFVELNGAMKDMDSKIAVKVDDIFTEVKENLDRDRKLFDVEATVKIEASVFDQEEKEVIIDAYSPSKKLKVEKKPVVFQQTLGKNTANMIVKETLDIPENQGDAFKILSVNTRPVLTDYSLTEDKTIIEGLIETGVLYLSQGKDQKVHSFQQEIPFRHFVEIPGAKENMEADVDLKVFDVDFSLINPEQVEVKVNVGAACVVKKNAQLEVLVNAEEMEEVVDVTKNPSMTIYFVQPGDTLWKIAKRYNTTVESIVKTNEISDENHILPGSQIIIQKNYEYKF
ncbi:DUF3794 and LysM peptidoglycan-binding domain-containing protein [Geosporobacter ferrireducens]|uniref:Peptidoglycan-binding protein n=1 Tax=Geosporobacter ferrireducens TaxID=1424294 RepID=A0A1D8GH01_9FIRM|nr:SPOCS domain-containing protein [Geosporobacter ferrireducens]AOT70189.1 peptidoglycan-binding protein [Geosporobacter ferrireducens]